MIIFQQDSTEGNMNTKSNDPAVDIVRFDLAPLLGCHVVHFLHLLLTHYTI